MTIVFADKATGRRMERTFSSMYLGMRFLNRVKHSDKLILISWSKGY